jgi:eukaryotic-like serine/threonine-protein kinase
VPDEQPGRRQAKAIFDEAAEIVSTQERGDYLDRACAGDQELRRQVNTLLRALDEAGGFLEVPAAFSPETAESEVTTPGSSSAQPGDCPTSTSFGAVDETGASDPEQAPGSRSVHSMRDGPGSLIGPYKLLQRIGEGGMGAVYLAEQDRPVRRRVALKVVKPGMDTEQVVARFEAERQALAIMDHPSIAKVFDAGVTDSGRPYFVMELVKGVPITEYCDAVHLTPKERLELFIPVCQAIQHAHQKGIIHRDIKPSNVLVAMQDGKPVPKVIDFGIAKAIDQRLTEKTFFTQHGAIIGTLEYMSPEQAEISAMDIDTRADIYALGVLLYELLTGSTPLERVRLREAGYSEILRRIREEEPPKPSTRLSESRDSLPSVAASRKTEPARLTRLLRGDLDWIVMKALEKDRTRRYESASGFARDIERHLQGDPVEAGPPSAVYRLRKLARKHRAGLITAAVVLLCLIGGIVGTTLGLFQARRQTKIAGDQRQKAQDRLIEIEKINRQLDESIRREGKANVDLKTANTQVQARFDLAMEAIKTFHTGVAEDVLLKNDNLKPMRDRLLQNAAGFYKRLEGELSSQTDRTSRRALAQAYYEMARLAGQIGATEQAIADHRQALAVRRELAKSATTDGEAKDAVARSLIDLAKPLAQSGSADEAWALYAEARMLLEGLVRDWPGEALFQIDLATCHGEISFLLSQIGKPEQALAALKAARMIAQKLADANPAETHFQKHLAKCHCDIGVLLSNTGKPAEALVSYQAARAIQQRLADAQPDVTEFQRDLATSHHNIGMLLGETGKPREALTSNEAARAILEKLASAQPAVTQFQSELALSHNNMGLLLSATGKTEEALASYAAARTIEQKLVDANPGVTRFQSVLANLHLNIGNLLNETGKPPEALVSYHAARAIQKRLADANPTMTQIHSELATTYTNIGRLLNTSGKPGDALTSFNAARAIQQRLADANPAVTEFQLKLSRNFNAIGVLLRDTGKQGEALVSYQAARVIQQRLADANPTVIDFQLSIAGSHQNIGNSLRATGKRGEALASLESARAIYAKLVDANPAMIRIQRNLANAQVSIGLLLKESGNPEQARASLQAARATMQGLVDTNPKSLEFKIGLANAHLEIGDVLRLAGEAAEARASYDKAIAIIESVGASQPNFADHLQIYRVFGLKGLGATQQSVGQAAEAVASWRRAIATDERTRTTSDETLYTLAGCHARLGGIAGTPGSGLSETQRAAALDTAMVVLRRAVTGGYRNVMWMKRDPDLDPLRGRPDFQQLMMDVEFPAWPFSTE